MQGMAKAFAYLIAAHVQAMGLVVFAWWLGKFLNQRYPQDFNWLVWTIPVGVLAMGQTFYLIIRNLLWQKKAAEKRDVKERG